MQPEQAREAWGDFHLKPLSARIFIHTLRYLVGE